MRIFSLLCVLFLSGSMLYGQQTQTSPETKPTVTAPDSSKGTKEPEKTVYDLDATVRLTLERDFERRGRLSSEIESAQRLVAINDREIRDLDSGLQRQLTAICVSKNLDPAQWVFSQQNGVLVLVKRPTPTTPTKP